MTNRYVVQPGAFYENPKTGKMVCSLVFPGSDKIKPGDTITLPDDRADEERFVTIGTDAVGRILVVVYTWRAERIRVISARRATRKEQRAYEEHR